MGPHPRHQPACRGRKFDILSNAGEITATPIAVRTEDLGPQRLGHEARASRWRCLCPICRHAADSEQWFTTAQIENAHAIGVEELLGQVDQAMARGTKSASRRAPSSGFISFSLDYKPGHRTYTAPLSATEVLEQRSTCGACGTRFASIGAAFF